LDDLDCLETGTGGRGMKLVGMITVHQYDPECSVVVIATLNQAMIPLDISDVRK